MSDMIHGYRTIDIRCDRANDVIPPIFAITGDDNGRILRVALTDNGKNVDSSEKLHAQLLINPSPYDSGSIGDLVDMTPVDGETATFETTIPAGAVSKPGLTRMGIAFLLDNTDGTQDIVCSRPFTVNVEQGVLRIESDTAIGAFEAAVRQAVASAQAAKTSETNASASATTAEQNASNASTSAVSAKTSETNAANSEANAKTSETAAKTSETNAAQSANAARLSAADAAASENAASTAAESATADATSAAESKDAAAQSAADASQHADAAKTSETNAAQSASNAAVSESNAAASATAAQQAVDGFGLTVGSTTTGEPGTDAIAEIHKEGNKYIADFTIPRGDQGEPSPLVTDTTLTGDGTSAKPLGVIPGFMPTITKNTWNADLNELTTPGIYYLTDPINGASIGARTSILIVFEEPVEHSIIQIQFQLSSGIPFVRSRFLNNWNNWKRLNSTTLQTATSSQYMALDTRVQALEATVKQLQANQ